MWVLSLLLGNGFMVVQVRHQSLLIIIHSDTYSAQLRLLFLLASLGSPSKTLDVLTMLTNRGQLSLEEAIHPLLMLFSEFHLKKG
jgi:hypothetical protein